MLINKPFVKEFPDKIPSRRRHLAMPALTTDESPGRKIGFIASCTSLSLSYLIKYAPLAHILSRCSRPRDI